MKDTRRQIIANTRNQTGPDPVRRDWTKSAKQNRLKFENVVVIQGVHNLGPLDDLLNLIDRHAHDYGNPGDKFVVRENKADDAIVCTVEEKNLALSLSHRIHDAYKGNCPLVEFHNPEKNEYYRIGITCHPQK